MHKREATAATAEPLSSLAGLSVVELEVGSRCNRACSYCPVSILPRPPVPARMSDEVLEKALDELVAIDFRGRVSYHLYNEPLLRVDLHELAARVRSRLPDALQVLNTNGDLLDDTRYDQLRESGIDYFIVTRHSPGPYPTRPWQVLQYSEDLVLTNRGGILAHLPAASGDTRHTPCHAPAEMLIVTTTGDVLLCYEDAFREHQLGNILTETLPEIWNAPHVAMLREPLALGDRTVTAMCQACTNVSHCEPGNSPLEPGILEWADEHRDDAVGRLKIVSERAR